MIRNKFLKLNNGVVSIYREKSTNRTDFNAKKNTVSLEDMTFIVKLCYEEMTKRAQDIEFAYSNDFSLSLKIKTRFVKNVDNKCKAVINNVVYNIYNLDIDKNKVMYLYLEKERDL